MGDPHHIQKLCMKDTHMQCHLHLNIDSIHTTMRRQGDQPLAVKATPTLTCIAAPVTPFWASIAGYPNPSSFQKVQVWQAIKSTLSYIISHIFSLNLSD